MSKTYDELREEYDRWYPVWRDARQHMAEASLDLYIAELRQAEPRLATVFFEWYGYDDRVFKLSKAVASDGTDVSQELWDLEDWENNCDFAEHLQELRRGLRERHRSADWIRIDVRTREVDFGCHRGWPRWP